MGADNQSARTLLEGMRFFTLALEAFQFALAAGQHF